MSTSSREILVVDDERGVLDLVALALREAGFKVRPCSTGAEAIAAYEEHHADVAAVLLDVQMRAPDGPHILAELQRINPGVRCVFMSGSTGRYQPDQLLELGACRVLQKPFSLAALVEAVRSAATPVG